MRIKDVERTDRSKTRENMKKATTYCPNCPDQTQLCIEASKFYILNNFLNKSSSHYFYNNSIILLLPVENTFQILSQVVKYVPPVFGSRGPTRNFVVTQIWVMPVDQRFSCRPNTTIWPDQELWRCHPNMGDALLSEALLPSNANGATLLSILPSPEYGWQVLSEALLLSNTSKAALSGILPSPKYGWRVSQRVIKGRKVWFTTFGKIQFRFFNDWVGEVPNCVLLSGSNLNTLMIQR